MDLGVGVPLDLIDVGDGLACSIKGREAHRGGGGALGRVGDGDERGSLRSTLMALMVLDLDRGGSAANGQCWIFTEGRQSTGRRLLELRWWWEWRGRLCCIGAYMEKDEEKHRRRLHLKKQKP